MFTSAVLFCFVLKWICCHKKCLTFVGWLHCYVAERQGGKMMWKKKERKSKSWGFRIFLARKGASAPRIQNRSGRETMGCSPAGPKQLRKGFCPLCFSKQLSFHLYSCKQPASFQCVSVGILKQRPFGRCTVPLWEAPVVQFHPFRFPLLNAASISFHTGWVIFAAVNKTKILFRWEITVARTHSFALRLHLLFHDALQSR